MASQLPEYTDLQRTRVVNRADAAAPSIGSTQPITPREGLFDGLSIPQIVAGAAAAATSVLLMSKIGVVGSVIGAALSSVITVVSTQVYRRILTAGARKLTPGGTSTGADADASRTAVTYRPVASAWGADATAESAYTANDATTYQPFGAASYRAPVSAGDETGGTRIAPTKLRARAAAERNGVQRKIVAASVVAAILAVALCAGIILITTAGEGLGARPNSIIYEPLAQDEGTTDGTDAQAGTQGADTSSDSAKDASTSQKNSSSGQQGVTNSSSSSTNSSSTDSNGSSSSSSSSDSSNTGNADSSGQGSEDGTSSNNGSTGGGSTSGTSSQGDSSQTGNASGADATQGTTSNAA